MILRDQFWRGGEWNVRVVMRHITEERPVAIALNEFLGSRGDSEFSLAAGLKGRQVCRRGQERNVKALLFRPEAGAAEVPLSEQPRGVARILQHFGDSYFLQWQLTF